MCLVGATPCGCPAPWLPPQRNTHHTFHPGVISNLRAISSAVSSGAVSLHLGVISNARGSNGICTCGAVSLHLGVISNPPANGDTRSQGAVSLHLGVISNYPLRGEQPRRVQSPFIWESSPTAGQSA